MNKGYETRVEGYHLAPKDERGYTGKQASELRAWSKTRYGVKSYPYCSKRFTVAEHATAQADAAEAAKALGFPVIVDPHEVVTSALKGFGL